ncbi:MAG: DUF427 domain-containing protein [Chloroflexi bacterium]|nr:DUF427 domain-containing protein [Chloroflexota bacterium]
MSRALRATPKSGRESVWDYPRPPRLEATPRRLRVIFAGETVADTQSGLRVLETSHPPVYYFPPSDVRLEFLIPSAGGSFCEWKGRAAYYSLRVKTRLVENAAWFYPNPTPAYILLKDFIAFYAAPMDACFVDDERVLPQPGSFYGGWITSDITGPFKGEPGTHGW